MNAKNMNAIWSVGYLQGQFDALQCGLSPDVLIVRAEIEDSLNFLATKIKESVPGGPNQGQGEKNGQA